MTLEQRVEALEMAIANMTVKQKTTDEMSEAMRKIASDTIASACRPGGVLNAAHERAASKLQKKGVLTQYDTNKNPRVITGPLW